MIIFYHIRLGSPQPQLTQFQYAYPNLYILKIGHKIEWECASRQKKTPKGNENNQKLVVSLGGNLIR